MEDNQRFQAMPTDGMGSRLMLPCLSEDAFLNDLFMKKNRGRAAMPNA